MAQVMLCDLCGDEPAAILVNAIQTGDVQTVGNSCMNTWAMVLVNATGGIPEGAPPPTPPPPADPEPVAQGEDEPKPKGRPVKAVAS